MAVPLKYVLGGVAGLVLIAALFIAAPWAASAQGNGATTSNALLTCEPSQQVVVRHVAVRGELQLSMQCVGATDLVGATQSFAPRPIRTSYASAAPATRTVRTSSAPRVVREAEPERSWKKTALVIGGSAGAGAGVGALAGGKKGALIGAAIGGGAASIFEAIKRN